MSWIIYLSTPRKQTNIPIYVANKWILDEYQLPNIDNTFSSNSFKFEDRINESMCLIGVDMFSSFLELKPSNDMLA